MVVDDDEDTLESLSDILRDSGYEVTTTASGKDALKKFDNTYDLVLIDLKLQDISGFEVMKFIEKKHPDTIMIVLTGYASVDSAIKALRLGAYDFLQKPIRSEFLIKAITHSLENKQLKNLYQEIIKKMDEGIAIVDSEGFITFTNSKFCEMLSYPEDELHGKHFVSLVAPENENKIKNILRNTQKGPAQRLRLFLITKDGRELEILSSFTNISTDILVVISDISEIASSPAIGKDFAYQIMPGNLYLVEEEDSAMARDVFTDLINTGYKGAVVTRDHPDKIAAAWGPSVHTLWLTENMSGKSAVFPNITVVEEKLLSLLSAHRAILIERLDYLILNSSFESVLKSIQRLRDQILLKKSIIILSVDPRTLTERHFSLLGKETSPLVPTPPPNLRDDLIELLAYVAKRNEVGKKPHHKEIRKRFNISRTTVRERLNVLSSKGLIIEKKKGRLKIIEITERGKKILNKYM